MSRRAVALFVAVLLVAVGLSWLMGPRGPARRLGEPGARVVDYYVNGFSAVRMDAAGRPYERLQAERVTHYPQERVMDVTRPHLVLYRPAETGEPPWQMDSATARVFEALDEIHFAGGVALYQEGARPLRLVTETMLIDTARQTAATDDPLTLTEPRGRVDAVGMRARLAERQVDLLGEVRGSHAAR